MVAVLAAEHTEAIVVVAEELHVTKAFAALIAEVSLALAAAHVIAALTALDEDLDTRKCSACDRNPRCAE